MLFLFWKSECKGNDWNVVVTAAPVALIVSPATSSFESSEKIGPHGNYVLIYANVKFSNLNENIGKSCGHPVMVQMVQFTAVQVLHFWRHRRWKLLILRIKRCIIWVAPVNKTFSPTQPHGALWGLTSLFDFCLSVAREKRILIPLLEVSHTSQPAAASIHRLNLSVCRTDSS